MSVIIRNVFQVAVSNVQFALSVHRLIQLRYPHAVCKKDMACRQTKPVRQGRWRLCKPSSRATRCGKGGLFCDISTGWLNIMVLPLAMFCIRAFPKQGRRLMLGLRSMDRSCSVANWVHPQYRRTLWLGGVPLPGALQLVVVPDIVLVTKGLLQVFAPTSGKSWGVV